MANLLVIDDDPAVREAVSQSLAASGYSVVQAEDGVVGIAQLSHNDVDLVLVDIVMPRKEGIETIQEIRLARPSLKIVAMSGCPFRDLYLSVACKLGADAVLTKPFETAELRDTVKALLAN